VKQSGFRSEVESARETLGRDIQGFRNINLRHVERVSKLIRVQIALRKVTVQ